MSGFGEDEAVVEEEIDNHNNERSENKGTGGEDEFVSEGEMNGLADIVGEFVEWSEEAE